MKHFVFLGAALMSVTTAQAQQVKPTCTDASRACMIAAATAYLDAIVTHDASKVPFAPDVKRTEGGRITGQGETSIRENTKSQPDMLGHANTRFFVDEKSHNVVAYTLLRIRGQKPTRTARPWPTGCRRNPARSISPNGLRWRRG